MYSGQQIDEEGYYIDSLSDEELLALCIWREDRSGGSVGMQAVANVIRNRSKAWNEPLRHVILERNQFSSMCSFDREYCLKPLETDPLWQQAKVIAQGVISGALPDITHSALYYWNPACGKSPWFEHNIAGRPEQHPKCAEIDGQEYFR